jgi:hypothetical protein
MLPHNVVLIGSDPRQAAASPGGINKRNDDIVQDRIAGAAKETTGRDQGDGR